MSNAPKTIILIDDRKAVSRILSALLATTKYADARLLAADDLQTALRYLEESPADLVLLDNHLPPYTHFRRPLAAIKKLTDSPVVVLTGHLKNDAEAELADTPKPADIWLKEDLSAEFLNEKLAQHL